MNTRIAPVLVPIVLISAFWSPVWFDNGYLTQEQTQVWCMYSDNPDADAENKDITHYGPKVNSRLDNASARRICDAAGMIAVYRFHHDRYIHNNSTVSSETP